MGERSSRGIERRCAEDVAFRVVAVNRLPDHATIARFRVTHQDALAGVFGQVLGLCARAGLIRPGLVAVDGTRMQANASRDANRSAEQLAKEILEEAATVDAEQDERLGAARGDELPSELVGSDRRARIRELLGELEADAAKRSYEAHLARRVEVEAAAGRRLEGRKPKPDAQHRRPRQLANITDPDSRLMRAPGGYVQGYNAQAVVTVDQFIVAAEVTNDGNDDAQFAPMVAATKTNLRQAGVRTRIRTVVADAGYWNKNNVDTPGVEALIAPGKTRNINRQVRTEARRAEVLSRVERGEISIIDATVELGVGRSRVDQLLLARAASCHQLPRSRWLPSWPHHADGGSTRSDAHPSSRCSGKPKHNRGIRQPSISACYTSPARCPGSPPHADRSATPPRSTTACRLAREPQARAGPLAPATHPDTSSVLASIHLSVETMPPPNPGRFSSAAFGSPRNKVVSESESLPDNTKKGWPSCAAISFIIVAAWVAASVSPLPARGTTRDSTFATPRAGRRARRPGHDSHRGFWDVQVLPFSRGVFRSQVLSLSTGVHVVPGREARWWPMQGSWAG